MKKIINNSKGIMVIKLLYIMTTISTALIIASPWIIEEVKNFEGPLYKFSMFIKEEQIYNSVEYIYFRELYMLKEGEMIEISYEKMKKDFPEHMVTAPNGKEFGKETKIILFNLDGERSSYILWDKN